MSDKLKNTENELSNAPKETPEELDKLKAMLEETHNANVVLENKLKEVESKMARLEELEAEASKIPELENEIKELEIKLKAGNEEKEKQILELEEQLKDLSEKDDAAEELRKIKELEEKNGKIEELQKVLTDIEGNLTTATESKEKLNKVASFKTHELKKRCSLIRNLILRLVNSYNSNLVRLRKRF